MSEFVSPEAELAVAHSSARVREGVRTMFALDARLARIVSATNEPMLGQMRLAWWREMLGKPVTQRPRGDAVLDAIGEHWPGCEAALSAMIDGWEHMLAEPFAEADARRFAAGRSTPWGALAERVGAGGFRAACERAGRRWALADAAAHIAPGDERDVLLALATQPDGSLRFPKPLRGLAVLDALARRAIARGGRPLMEGRGASLVAGRAAILGR